MSDEDEDEDEAELRKYHEQAKSLEDAFRNASHNLIGKIEKLGFTYVAGEEEDVEEIAEERVSRPKTDFQMELVSYFDGKDMPTERLLDIWCEETQREDTPFPLWRRYFRRGNPQLKKLILFGLDQKPTARSLLDNLSILHSFLPMPKEFLVRYTLACELEDNPARFRELAQDFEAGAASFDYDALTALRASCNDKNAKRKIIDDLLFERQKQGGSISF
jgi:hypothetical protein